MKRFFKPVSGSTSNTNVDDLSWDPAERKEIMSYHPNERDEIRRKYLVRGPCQPYDHPFKKTKMSNAMRRFNPAWFEKYEGFCNWNKPDRLDIHMGKSSNSSHCCAAEKCDNLMKQGQSIVHALFNQDNVGKKEYHIRLNVSIDVSRYLLRLGLSFRGHDESEESANRGNFLQLMKYTGDKNDAIKQMAIVFRFVDKSGAVKERFIGVVHVKETSSASLKSAIDNLFAKYGLSLKRLRGQGYGGASNMKGEFNGLRALVVRENSAAYYLELLAKGKI
ncbi:PREDICTED: uncharacterized protein LOC104715460 [Camelina sativa]|uniref:Uncharacterized protein LOC104715460 n=1 Tax=Camelina sativa TaxID=90675 RepID=A0ABM0TTJ9_CAMSA|nr:PREDICTED: uncharacterized protein LOC104715460 [Camelina sativa]